jgi:hypothetical protein
MLRKRYFKSERQYSGCLEIMCLGIIQCSRFH